MQVKVKALLSKRPELDINDGLYKFLPPEDVLEKLEHRLARFPHNIENPKFFTALVESCEIYNRYAPLIKALDLYKLSVKNYTDYLERFYESLDGMLHDYFQDNDVVKALVRFDAKAYDYFKTQNNLSYFKKCNRQLIWKLWRYMIRTGQDESEDFDSRYVCEWFAKTLIGLEWGHTFSDSLEFQRRMIDHVLDEMPYVVEQYEKEDENNAEDKIPCCGGKQSYLISVLTSLMEVIDGYNGKARDDAIVLEDYPELYKIYAKYLKMNSKGMSYEYFCQTFQKAYPRQFYKICRSDDTSSEEKRAVKIAKMLYFNYNDMNFDEYWKDYLEFCKKWLKRYKGHMDRMSAIQLGKAQQLLKRVKWFQDVPWKFVESCMENLKDEGNVRVLAYLLEGPAFEKLVKGQDCLDNTELSVIKVEPPVSLRIIKEFKELREDTVALLSSLVRRIPLDRIMSFVPQVAEAPSELKIVYFKALLALEPLEVSRRLVQEFWQSEQDGPYRAFAIKKVIDHFKNWPSSESLQMLKQCIEAIDDSEVQNYIPVNNLICECHPAYLSGFIDYYLEKISRVRTAHRPVLVCTVAVYLDAVRAQLLYDNVLQKLALTYFEANDSHMMIVVGRFIVDAYLLGSLDDRTFNERMRFFKDKILAEVYKLGATRFEHFVTQSLNEFQQNVGVKHDRKLKILEAFDQYFETERLNRQEKVDLFFNIKVYQEYLASETPEQYADRLIKLIPKLLSKVPDLSSTVSYTVLLSAIVPINNFSDSTVKNRPSGVFRVAKFLAQNKTYQLAPNLAVDLLYNYESMREYDLPTYQETLEILRACEIPSVVAAVQRIVNLMETKKIQ
uniref:Uncharacterized protein n=1 Tax=Trichogramma kaykai TaxID=54128 RepID=A0ABD2WRW6_9HYME